MHTPQYDLVGVYVYSDAKIGRDVGELCGLEPTGIDETTSTKCFAARPLKPVQFALLRRSTPCGSSLTSAPTPRIACAVRLTEP